MKHNFSAWRYLDPAPAEVKGGAILESIQKNHKETLEQIEAVKTAHQKALDDKIKEVKDDFETRATEAKSLAQKTADKLEEIEKKGITAGIGGNGQHKSFSQQLEEKITANKANLPLSVGKKFSFDIDTKAVGNLGSAANLTGSYFVPPTVVPGVFVQPYNQTHMRDVLNTGQTDSNIIRYIRDNGGEGGPTTVAEAGTKPQMDRDLAIVDAPVRKIATYLRVPEEMIEDIPYLTSFLTNVGTQEVMAVEDTQIIYGDGTGQNLSGLATAGNFTAYAADAGGGAASGVVAAPNEYDVLTSAVKQMRVLKRVPTVHLVSPVDYWKMVSRKDTTNNYILQGGGNGLVPATAGGVPITQMNQIAAGDFITLDKNAAQIYFRSNINVRFYEQDQDNAIKNMVTIVIEERLALCIYYVTGIIKGTFAAAITDLTS
jgi:HK97 family phage major capsid protein